jgi:hypothetical protein
MGLCLLSGTLGHSLKVYVDAVSHSAKVCTGKESSTTRGGSRTIIFRIPLMVGASAVKVIGSVSVAWRSQGYDISAQCFDYARRRIGFLHFALNPRYEVTCFFA